MMGVRVLLCCALFLGAVLGSCASPYKGKQCIDIRKITWNCQDYCEIRKDQGITDPRMCKGGCWLMSEYVKPVFSEIVTLGVCTDPDYTTRCVEALDAVLSDCTSENQEAMTWDVEVGLFRFVHELQDRCFELFQKQQPA